MMDGELSNEDRRSCARVPISEFVELQIPESPTAARALAVNLSASGLAVSHVVFGSVGQRIQCKLPFTPREPLAMDCRVVWVREASADQDAAMGLHFEDLTETRRDRLVTYLARLAPHTGETELAIDPFCESGTWTPEALPAVDDAGSIEQTQPDPGTVSIKRAMRHPLRWGIYFAAALAIGALVLFLLAI